MGILLAHVTPTVLGGINIGDVELLANGMVAIYWVSGSAGMTINVADSRNALQWLFSEKRDEELNCNARYTAVDGSTRAKLTWAITKRVPIVV